MNFDFIRQRFSGRRSPFLNQPMFLQAWADFICTGCQAIRKFRQSWTNSIAHIPRRMYYIFRTVAVKAPQQGILFTHIWNDMWLIILMLTFFFFQNSITFRVVFFVLINVTSKSAPFTGLFYCCKLNWSCSSEQAVYEIKRPGMCPAFQLWFW